MVTGATFLEREDIGMLMKLRNILEQSESIRNGKYSSYLSMLHMLVAVKTATNSLLRHIHGWMIMVLLIPKISI